MYAVIENSGKQYKVAEGDTIHIDLAKVAPESKTIELDKILFLSTGKEIKVGNPYIEGAKIIASFNTNAQEAVVKGPKLYPTHFRRRKNSRRRVGHRQQYLQVTISKIKA
jgi:large subunit ribosomal protein L21